MKAKIILTMLAVTLFTNLSFGSSSIPIPFGAKEKIIPIMELPDQKEFQMADGRYFDLGSHYKIDHLLWLAFGHTEPELIGYLGNSDEYVVLTGTMLEAIKKTTNGSLATMAEVSFMDKIGGKILLGVFALLALYSIYSSYFSKVLQVKEEESIAY